jgi:cytochrome c oxidase cbb3-type subunit I/II
MPPYTWLFENDLDTTQTAAKIHVLRKLNVPYTEMDEATATRQIATQAKEIADRLAAEGYQNMEKKEVVALIAYLQRLGKHPTVNQYALRMP